MRFVLDKTILITNYVSVKDIVKKLYIYFEGNCYIVYSSENSVESIIRIYLTNQSIQKSKNQISSIVEMVSGVLDYIIKGIKDITVATIDSIPRTIILDDGSVTQKKEYAVFTKGINIFEVLHHKEVDPTKIQCDSITEMNNYLGIGYSRYKIMQELQTIVANKDYRHYTCIADEMTVNGNITSIERNGMGVREPGSVLLRMCNASPIQIIEDACLYGVTDKVSGVAPYLLTGQPPKLGTLYSEIVLDEEYVSKNVISLEDQLNDL